MVSSGSTLLRGWQMRRDIRRRRGGGVHDEAISYLVHGTRTRSLTRMIPHRMCSLADDKAVEALSVHLSRHVTTMNMSGVFSVTWSRPRASWTSIIKAPIRR